MLLLNCLNVIGVAALMGLLFCAFRMVYNIFFHPLAKFPGPPLWKATCLPYVYYMAKGKLTFRLLPLHAKYGSVVRIAPDELSFTAAEAWTDIYGHRVGMNAGVDELPKSERFYRTKGTLPNIIGENRENHALLRRVLSHGFSERSLREQEPIIVGYADQLVRQLRKYCVDGDRPDEKRRGRMDLTSWYNWVTVDIISDLTFGEGSGCLERAAYDPWVVAINGTIEDFIPLLVLRYLGLEDPFNWLVRRFFNKKRKNHTQQSTEKLRRRMDLETQRPDFIDCILQKKDAWNLQFEQLLGNASTLLVAGSETTATLLTAMTFILLKHPEALNKLTQEIRSSFTSDNEITLASVTNLPYMLACLNEAMRYYPPVPIGPLRTVPKGGVNIAGHFVPEGTDVAVWHWPMFHDPKHFERPMEYRPERFLRDGSAPMFHDPRQFKRDTEPPSERVSKDRSPEFAGDNLKMVQPFNIGPRNCLGRNLAYAEMRLILARMIFNFDIELADPDFNWLDQKAYFLWSKLPLDAYLTPVTKNEQQR